MCTIFTFLSQTRHNSVYCLSLPSSLFSLPLSYSLWSFGLRCCLCPCLSRCPLSLSCLGLSFCCFWKYYVLHLHPFLSFLILSYLILSYWLIFWDSFLSFLIQTRYDIVDCFHLHVWNRRHISLFVLNQWKRRIPIYEPIPNSQIWATNTNKTTHTRQHHSTKRAKQTHSASRTTWETYGYETENMNELAAIGNWRRQCQ